MSVWDGVGAAIRREAARTAQGDARPARAFKVIHPTPLIIEELNGDLVLEEGDPDFTLADDLRSTRPTSGDLVVVDTDEAGDYVARGGSLSDG